MKQLIRKILKEESLKQTLINSIEEYGYIDTAEMVGGVKNLMDIVGEEKIMDLLISCFTDLNVRNRGGTTSRGGDTVLYDNHLPLLEKKSSFWGLPLIVYNSGIEQRILIKLGDDMVEIYRNVRRDFIKELIKMFPEFNVGKVNVFKNSGLYEKLDSFEL